MGKLLTTTDIPQPIRNVDTITGSMGYKGLNH